MAAPKQTTLVELAIKLELGRELDQQLFDRYFATFEAVTRTSVLGEFGQGYDVFLSLQEGSLAATVKLLTRAGAFALGLETFVVQAPNIGAGLDYLGKCTATIYQQADRVGHELLEDVKSTFQHRPPKVEQFRIKLPAADAIEQVMAQALTYERAPPNEKGAVKEKLATKVRAAARLLSDDDQKKLLQAVGNISPMLPRIIEDTLQARHIEIRAPLRSVDGSFERVPARRRYQRTKIISI